MAWRGIALTIVLALALPGVARAVDCGVTAKAVIFDRTSTSGKARVKYRSHNAPCANKGPAGTENQLSGSFDILYIDGGSNRGAFLAPAPWDLNLDAKARYLNRDAPVGGGLKKIGIRNNKNLIVGTRTLGDGPEIDISTPPGPSGVLAVTTINNAAGPVTNRLCTRWWTAGGSRIAHKLLSGGLAYKLKLSVGQPTDCNVVGIPTTTSSTTTSSSSTSSTSSTSTTSTSLPPSGLFFATGLAGGTCGHTYEDLAATTIIHTLTCGGLNIGGGGSTVAEGPTPDGSTSRFLTNCIGDDCTLSASPTSTLDYLCTDTGCEFGTPLPIPNGGLSTCVQNTFASPGSGTLNTATGVASLAVPLNSHVVVTANVAQPCPICRIGSIAGAPCVGTPGSPCLGVCEGSPNQGAACRSTNSQGLSNDCPVPDATAGNGKCYQGTNNAAACASDFDCPGGKCSVFVGVLSVDLTPLSTDTEEKSDAAGLFCPGQSFAGCFTNPGSADCRLIREVGVPAGPVPLETPTAVTLASVFCIPASGNLLIDGAASLPGPGAISLPGTFLLNP